VEIYVFVNIMPLNKFFLLNTYIQNHNTGLHVFIVLNIYGKFVLV